MSRKIKIQTVDKTKSTELENTLKENICTKTNEKGLDVPDVIEKTRKIMDKLREEDNNPCNNNTGDAIASTNDVDSTVVNIQDIKLKKLIDKFKDIILDVTTDDFTDNMSLYEEFIKKSRRNGIILEEDFQNFMDVINIEKFKAVTDVPKDIYKLTAKLHANKEYFNRVNVLTELAGYYNFLINKLFIPIENITENSYFFKLADKYISNYNKFEFNIPNENIDNFAQNASTNYKNIMSQVNSIGDEKNEYKKHREYFNSEDSIRHLNEHYNSADSLIAREKANKDSIRFNNLTGEKTNPINDVTKEFKQAKVIGKAFKTFRDENGVTKYGKLEDVKKILENISENNDNTTNIDDKYYGVDNQVGELVLSIPEENMDTLTKTESENKPCNMVENSTTYEEVNHPDHYNVYDVEVVEMMERIFGIEETMSWCKLNAFKYRMRAGEKPTSTVEKDLKKEKWCLNKYKELKSKK
jgi:hypothetical protein